MEEPPEVLKPGKLGLGGPRPERIDGMLTSPCSLGPMHGFTWGKTADARVVNFNGQTSWRITPRFFYFYLCAFYKSIPGFTFPAQLDLLFATLCFATAIRGSFQIVLTCIFSKGPSRLPWRWTLSQTSS